MLPVKWNNAIQPQDSKLVTPLQRVSVTQSPFTVKSTGLTQSQYLLTDSSFPDFDALSNLDLLFSGVTSIVGFYSGKGAPLGVSRADNFAIRYTGYFYTGLNGGTSFTFKSIGFGNLRLELNNQWLLGGASSYQSLDQHTYNEASINLTAYTWYLITIDYYTTIGEAGFALLWKDNVTDIFTAVGAGVTSDSPSFIETQVLSHVNNVSAISSRSDVDEIQFEIPIVKSSNTINGYKYDSDFDKYINVLDVDKFLKKYSMIEVEVGFKQDNKVLSVDATESFEISFADQTDFDWGLDDIMWETWFRTTATGTANLIVNTLNQLAVINGQLFFQIKGAHQVLSTLTSYNDGSWYHVVAVVDKSSATGLKIYVNGSEVTYASQDDPTSQGSITENATLAIGSGTFDGAMDEVKLWRYGVNGLPADFEEIISHHYYEPHKLSILTSTSNLKARWLMQDITSTASSLKDVSGNNNNLTIA